MPAAPFKYREVQPSQIAQTSLNESADRSKLQVDASRMTSEGPKEVAARSEEVDDDADFYEDKRKRKAADPFPLKLYRLLEEAEREGNEDVVSFYPHGQAFGIHRQSKFITDMMPRYFNTGRLHHSSAS